MISARSQAVLLSMLVGCLPYLFVIPAAAQHAQDVPEVVNEISHDTSLPLWMLPQEAPQANRMTIPLHRRPGAPFVGTGVDEAVQTFALPEVGTTNMLSFDGVNARDGVAPPDTNASVGATQVVQTVNLSYEVFAKATGAPLLGPLEISSIFTGLTGPCGSAANLFSDPVVLFDKAAGRWFIAILASSTGFTTGVECVAVSKTGDATGAFFRYSFGFGSALNDYGKFGVWPDAYYASYNMFSTLGSFIGPKVCAYNRAKMLAGAKTTAVCFQRHTSDFSFLPSDLDGSTPPAPGTPDFFLELATTTSLKLFKFHVDFVTPANSTFAGTALAIPSFTQACAATGTCIPQAGTTQKLDSLGDRLMFRLAYRNFVSHESLVASHSVKVSPGPASSVRWYEIQNPSTVPVVFQSGTFTVTGKAVWMPSIAMDQMGEIAVGFSQSSSTTHPAIAYTGRIPADPLGTLESEFIVLTGGGSQTGGLSRWGDYSSMSIDPSDDCTFWYTTEYIPKNGSFNWNTHLNSFKFPNCP